MKINFWFENDEYLNVPADLRESGIYAIKSEDKISVIKEVDSSKINNKVNNIKKDKIFKIKKIKESLFEIFSEDNLFDVKKFVELFEKLYIKDDVSHRGNTSNIANKFDISGEQISLSGDKNAKSIKENTSVISEDSLAGKSLKKNMPKVSKVKRFAEEIKNNIFDGLFTF